MLQQHSQTLIPTIFHNLSCLRKADYEYLWTQAQFSRAAGAVLAVVNVK